MCEKEDCAEGWEKTNSSVLATLLASDLGKFAGLLSTKVIQRVKTIILNILCLLNFFLSVIEVKDLTLSVNRAKFHHLTVGALS